VVVATEGGAGVVKGLWTLLRAEWDRAVGLACIAAGAVALVLGYQGVADSAFVSVQLPYIVSGGFGGLFLCAVGVGLLVMADLHDEWRKLDRIETAILSGTAPPPADLRVVAPARPRDVLAHQRFTALGLGVGVGLLVIGWQRAAGTTRPGVGFQGVAIAAGALTLAVAVIAAGTVGRRVRLARTRSALLGAWLTSAAPDETPTGGDAR
jgi:hypothetical protein